MKTLRQLLNFLFCSCNCGFTSFRIIISANQIRTGNTIPIDIPELTNPGVGYAWSIAMAELKYSFGTIPFTSTTLFLCTDTASVEQMVTGKIMDAQTSSFSKFSPTGSSDTSIAENKKICILTNADSPSGDGTCVVYGVARKIQL